MRHNLSQAYVGEMMGVSQPTISRAVCALTALTGQALEGWLLTAQEIDPRQSYVLDGTPLPCWAWKDHNGLYSGKHRRTGLSLQVLVTLDGRLVWAADPLPGSAHDVRALDVSGLLEVLDPATIIADKGYIGRGLITPPKKTSNTQRSELDKEHARDINKIRYVVERLIAHLKNCRILATSYRPPHHTHKEIITATLSLFTYATN
ncbi:MULTISPECIES: transposase family protein [Actinomyces]|nr:MULTISPECIES: transposase family protein [Actinomyces]